MEEDLRGKQGDGRWGFELWVIGEECEEGELLGRWTLGQVMVGDESGDKSDQAESPPPSKANQIFGFKNSSSTISS